MTTWIAAIVKLIIDSFKTWWAAKRLADLEKDLARKKETSNESLKTATDSYTDFMHRYAEYNKPSPVTVTPNGNVPKQAADLRLITGQGGSGSPESASGPKRDEPGTGRPGRRYSRTSRTVRRRKKR